MRKMLIFSVALGLSFSASVQTLLAKKNNKPALASLHARHMQQQNTVRGSVRSQGHPLEGVTVAIVGGTGSTMTDAQGNFSLQVPIGARLRFTFVGYISKEVLVNQDFIQVQLEAASSSLDEVVVVGYGTQKKGNLTGSVSFIPVKEYLEGRPIADVGRGIQGTTPGLTITVPSGEVGSDPKIKIRGAIASIQGNGNPLILLDNVEIPSIQYVNPDDVESITVLKDAASSSIYGAKAAFGVILIRTKLGAESQRITLNYSHNFSFQNLSKKFEMGQLSALKYTLDAMTRVGANISGAFYYLTPESYEKAVAWEKEYGGKLGVNDPTVFGRDWYVDPTNTGRKLGIRSYNPFDYMVREWAPTTTQNASIAGNMGKTRFTASFAHIDQSGMLKPGNSDKFRRINAALRLSTDINKYITFRAGAMFAQRNKVYPYTSNSSTADMWYYMYRWGPLYAMGNDENGNPIRSPFSEFAAANEGAMKRSFVNLNAGTTINLMTNWKVDVDYNFTNEDYHWNLPGTRFTAADNWAGPVRRLDANGDQVYVNADGQVVSAGAEGAIAAYDLNNHEYTSPGANPDHIYARAANTYKHTLNAFTTYNLNTHIDHDLKFILGANLVTDNSRYNWTQRTNLLDISNPQFDLATGTVTGSGGESWGAQLGYFGRINYAFKNKYLLEANIRYDGSSNFPKQLRWRWFPSFSAGWVVSEENFMDWSRNVLSQLKFRGSWGVIGNQAVPSDLYVSNMSAQQGTWIADGNRVVNVGTPALRMENISWEDLETIDIGLDARFFNNKLGLMFDYFERRTKHMFAPMEGTTFTLGGGAPQANTGNLTTQGFEVAVDYTHRFKNGLGINFRANFDDAKSVFNKYTSSRLLSGNYDGRVYGDIWGYVTDRLFQYDDFVLDVNGAPQLVKLTPEMTKYYTNGQGDSYLLKDGADGSKPVYQALLENTATFNFGPGDVKFKDLNGDGEIDSGDGTIDNPGDKKIIGNFTPRYNYGLRLGADFKGIDFSLFFQGVGRRAIWGDGALAIPGYNTADGAMSAVFSTDYWTSENTGAYYPAAFNNTNSNNANNMQIQSKYLLDMSYLRIKNITLGYTLPKQLLNPIYLNSLRFYVALENFFTWDNLKGLPIDPEEASGESIFNSTNYNSGRTGVGTPTFKSFSFGLQLNF